MAVGAIYRGSEGLEGVLSGYLGDGDPTEEVIRIICSSKHVGQVRFIVYRSSDLHVDPIIMSQKLGKPVLVLRENVDFNELLMIKYGEMVVEPLGIDGAFAMRVLKVISRGNDIPAMRTARLVSSNISEMHNV